MPNDHQLTRCSAPFYVQFEITNACNNRCFFCYNEVARCEGRELSTKEIMQILDQLKEAGVFSVNFNGGEPLLRKDFFELAAYAHNLGFDLHLNTNGTLISDPVALKLAQYFPSVCLSLLSAVPDKHDKLAGRVGAFSEVMEGMKNLQHHSVPFEVNVCTMTSNYQELHEIAGIIADRGANVLCVTRYILTDPKDVNLILNCEQTIEVIHTLERIKADFPTFSAVHLPGPVPFCELPVEYRHDLASWNIPCLVGFGLCRISPTGVVTPCTISETAIGDLRRHSFREVWSASGWTRYEQLAHLPPACLECEDLPDCRGGCIVYDECLTRFHHTPQTKKWAVCRSAVAEV